MRYFCFSEKKDFKRLSAAPISITASQLQGGRLVGEVEEAARACYEQVKGVISNSLYLLYSVSVGVKTALSNPSNKEIYDQI